jgi:hypothetical protein
MRYVKDVEKVQMFLNQYKYYIEDVSHELAFEEDYNEEPLIQVTDSN